MAQQKIEPLGQLMVIHSREFGESRSKLNKVMKAKFDRHHGMCHMS